MIGAMRVMLRMIALAGMVCTLPGARAATLSRADELPRLPPMEGSKILSALNGHAVILTAAGAFVVNERSKEWTVVPSAWSPDKVIARGDREAWFAVAGGILRGVTIATLAGAAINRRDVPLPPSILENPVGAWEGEALLICGTGPDGRPHLYRHDPRAHGWIEQSAWPAGTPRAIATQNGMRVVVTEDGRLWHWSAADGWRRGAAPPEATIGAPAKAGQAHLLFVSQGGDTASLYSYDTITDAWADLGRLPIDRPTAAVPSGDGLLVAASQPQGLSIWKVSPAYPKPGLSDVDQAIIAAYMLSMLGVGVWFYTRTNADSANEFFLGNRRIPFWAAGLSMFAGTIGSVNYLAYPAKSFETDWQYLMSKATYVGALIVVAIWLAPFLRRLNIVSVNAYLEDRFHFGIRLLASGLWIVLQLGARMGIILYLPALAVHSMTGIGIVPCIVAIGAFTIVYTALGGMRAVVWTDVVQVFVLLGGAVFAIGYVFWSLGVGSVVDTALAFGKMRAINLSLDVHQPTIWTFLLLAVLEGILCFPRDQIVMQRVLSTSSPREATWSILTFAAVLLPSAVMFYGIGTALFAFYRAHPAALDPGVPIDAVFPTFIGAELPRGIVGLVVSGVLAAAMGVLSGIINSVATLLSVDFYERFVPARSQRQIVRFSEIVSIAVGLIGVGIAILLSRLNVHSLLDLTIELGGVFGGSFAGAFPLGIFTTRGNWQGAAIGIVTSAVVTLAVWSAGAVHPYLYLAIAIFVSLVIGYLASLFFPPPSRSLVGLTVFTRARAAPSAAPRPA